MTRHETFLVLGTMFITLMLIGAGFICATFAIRLAMSNSTVISAALPLNETELQ